MDNKLYIPEKIRVGFQEREGTYTGKLAYIIYYDEKGKIRKETSFDGWRDEKIDVLELDNKPRNGYLFNKGVQRYAYHFGSGRSMLRVYDPRDFEFEIDIDNLEAILMNSDVSKKEIMGEFVFAWSGKDLILLPVNSQEYKDSVQYTENQYKKVSTKDLIKGATYTQKKNDSLYIYVGYLDWNDTVNSGVNTKIINKGKKHVFFERQEKRDINDYYYEKQDGFSVVSVSTFSECINEEPVDDFPEIVQEYEDSYHSQKSLGFEFGKINNIFVNGYYKDRSGELIKKINDNEYAVISFEKRDSYQIKQKSNYGGIEYAFRCSLYEKVGENFQYVSLSQSTPYSFGRDIQESEYTKFQKKIAQEIIGENESILLKDLKSTLEREGYARPCTKREDGKLFYIEKRFQ